MTHESPVNAMQSRSSVRSFTDRDIAPKLLDQLLTAACQAPTGGNLQPYSFVVVRDEVDNRWLADNCHQAFIGEAPVNVLVCLDFHLLRAWAQAQHAPFVMHRSLRHFWISAEDALIAGHALCTAAELSGLGTVYIGTIIEFLPDIIQRFAIPKLVLPLVLITMGYPAADPPDPRPRLPVEAVVHHGRYQVATPESADAYIQQKWGTRYANFPMTAERQQELEQVVREVDGDQAARTITRQAAGQEKATMAQRYFVFHYTASHMISGNPHFRDVLAQQGFCFDDLME